MFLYQCKWPGPWFMVTGWSKWKNLCQLSCQVLDRFGLDLVCCWHLLVIWTAYYLNLIQLYLYSRETSQPRWFWKKTPPPPQICNVSLHSDICGPITFRTCSKTDIHEFCIWYQFVWSWSSFKVTVVWESKTLCAHLLTNVSADLDEIQYGATTCWFVEAPVQFLLHNQYSKERTVLRWSDEILACVLMLMKLACFKPGLMIETANLCSLVPV